MLISKKMIEIKLKFWIKEAEINNWFGEKNVFFILSQGRSGTSFLANLLDKSAKACVEHEPVREDFQAYQGAFHSEKKALKYIKNFRKREIYFRVRNRNIEIYGEVNSLLRRHYKALKDNFPNATFIHLIRDGRDVVRSMMSRRTMTPEDPNTKLIYPKEGDPYKEKWLEMSRFEKLCWYWQEENRYLRENIQNLVKFEEILKDYEYFRNNILEKIGICLSEEIWKREVNNPKNVTKEYSIPPWSEWDKKKKDIFKEICASEMRKNKYEI